MKKDIYEMTPLRFVCSFCLLLFPFFVVPETPSSVHDRVWTLRNLGKAYYENPVTQLKAPEEFRQALALAPNSVRDRVNLGLSLLRIGDTEGAITELKKAQQADPTIPHTWFNLGITYKKQQKNELAIEQLQGMLKLVPDEPVTHYNLGVLYRLDAKSDLALREFEQSSRIDPTFAAPHFQLYNAYRELGRKEDSARELDLFNDIKKRKAGAAVPEDPEWSRYSEIYDVVELDGDFDHGTTAPPYKFEDQKIAEGMDTASAGMAVLDFDGDGRPDLIVWSENGAILLKNGVSPVAGSGLEGLKGIVTIAPGDFDNDGLPDLAVITHSRAELYVNHNGKFEPSQFKLPSGSFKKAIWVDYDHDYDLDLILLGSKSMLLRNEGQAGFSDQTAHFPFAGGTAIDGTVFDLIPDNNEADLAVAYDDGSIVVYHDRHLGNFEPQLLPNKVTGVAEVQALDINNDGWTDLVISSSSAVHLLRNDRGKLTESDGPRVSGPVVLADVANRGFADAIVGGSVYRNLGAGKFELARVAPLVTGTVLAQADFDGDGRTDLAAVSADGSVHLFKNVTETSNKSVTIRLEGVKNLRRAAGAVIEVKTGAWYQRRTYNGTPLLFGVRAYAGIDTVRITWANGLVQNETAQPVGKELSYKEMPRLSGSCPTIFAWNGSKFEFITDILGVAPLGASSGDGEFFPVNHRERVKIPGESLLATDHGDYELRITEELREVSYLDKLQLIAVDHPAAEEIFTNDKFQSPPYPRFRIYGITRRIYPVSARDQAGNDVLDRLAKWDGQFVDTFRRNRQGIAEMHYLDLDFGSAVPDGRAVLVLNGWVDWPDGSTFLAASQESKDGLVFPYLQVKDAAGHWQTVVQDMGMPSGKPKPMVVDLNGKFLSSSREIRIVTNLSIYWDEIFLAASKQRPVVRLMPLVTTSADLHYRGFSKLKTAAGDPQPEQFEYDNWTATTMWNPTPGLYTRYGSVTDLLAHVDDRMVIMGSGDELRLRFNPRSLPQLPAGWKRDFLLSIDGWAKDKDPNTAYAESVEPLPFHGMSRYPYPASEHFPDDREHQIYQRLVNTRLPVRDLESLRQP